MAAFSTTVVVERVPVARVGVQYCRTTYSVQ